MSDDRGKLNMDDRFADLVFDSELPNPDKAGSPPGTKATEAQINDIHFDILPEELIKYLKGYIVGQDNAIETVATKICTHFHRMYLEKQHAELPRIVGHVKSNMLLIGPTGVGKTYLVRLIANKLNVPFVKGDATKFSETGYVGGDVEDLIRELVYQVDGNIKLAEYGIVYIDEIDKIASAGSWNGPDVSRSGVQRNLLKLMEETEVDMKVPHDLASQMEAVLETQRTGKASRKKINTRNILFIMSGAFLGLPEIISRRLKKGGMGFSDNAIVSAENVEFLFAHKQSQDMIDYGFESEFIGRVPVITELKPLDVEGLYRIVKNPLSSVIQSKKRDFAAYKIELDFEDDALRILAEKAQEYKTGARGLVSVFENILMPFERSLPSTSIRKLTVSADLCNDPEQYLNKMVNRHAFESYSQNFLRNTGITINFSDEAKEILKATAISQSIDLKTYLDERFKNYDYGLKLIELESFDVTPEVIEDTQKYLDRLIKENYHRRVQ